MNKPARIALFSLGGLALLALSAVLSVLLIARSEWLREKLRAEIVEQAETATGGRVEIAKFRLDWTGLTADVDGLVIHGTEAPSQAPFLAVEHVTIGFRIVSLFSRDVRLNRIDVGHPRVHLVVDSDGGVNLPRPKVPGKARTSDTILDLKIARFEVRDGEALVEFPGSPPHQIPWSGDGRNLTALVLYDRARDRYSGDVSLAPVHLTLVGYGPLDVDVQASAAMDRDNLTVSKAKVKSAGSEIALSDLTLGSFAAPVVTANFEVNSSTAEVFRVLHSRAPVSGNINVAGKVRYVSPVDFTLTGAFRGSGLAYGAVRNIRLAGNLAGTQAKMSLTGLHANALGGEASGSVELKGYDVYRIDAKIAGLGVRDLAALGAAQCTGRDTRRQTNPQPQPEPGSAASPCAVSGECTGRDARRQTNPQPQPEPGSATRPCVPGETIPYDGVVSGTVAGSGKLRDLSLSGLLDATAQLTVAPAAAGPAVHGEIAATYTAVPGAAAKLELGRSWIELPHTRADVTGTLGGSVKQLTVKLETKDLNDLLPALNGHTLPFSLRDGSVSFAGTVNGTVEDPRIAGHATLHNAVYEGELVDSASGDVAASMNQASVANASIVYEGVTASGNGSIALTEWGATDASAIVGNVEIGNVDLTHALALAGYKEVDVNGTLTAAAHVSGTLGQPVGSADMTLSKGLIYQQPYDSITSHLQYVSADLQKISGAFVSGPKRVTFDVAYPHAGQPFPAGTLQISATSNVMALNQIALVRQRQPDIQGAAQFRGTAAVRVSLDAKKEAHFDLVAIDGDGSATKIELGGRDLGDSHITARTQGSTLTASFDSNAAKAVIRGQARVELTGDDRTSGSVTFSNAGLNALAALIVTENDAKNIGFDGSAEGQVDFNGPLFTPLQMSATATIGQIEVHPLPGTPLTASIPGFSIRNNGPVRVSFEKSVIRVDEARFVAPETDTTLSGTVELAGSSPLNLRLQGDVSLAMLRNFVPDLACSGTVAVTGNIRGSWNAPDLGGHATIRGGEFHFADFTNGLTNATGEIVFSGTRATIQSFSADTGGGKFTGSGAASLGAGGVAFQFSARTKDVRLRYPQGISSTSDSDIQIVRSPQRSAISGTITVRRLVFNPQQDTAGTLADMSRSAPTPVSGDNSLANMNLDVLIQTAPDVALQSKVAESIQADASLRLRGTVASPALLGRVNISQGSVLFFGNKYTISRGSVSFFNPTKIDPVLDVDLQTRARGVDVTLTVTGPPSHLGMTYRSDPPLEFSDIVALLATGRTPDDPSVALRGNAPTPSFEQLGASTLIGETLANPVAERLQRFFGVSRIKIDPQLAGVGGTPGARLTVEQQVTPDLLFTYITDVSDTSQQLIRAEWAFNPRWSAILAREENGYVGVDFQYKIRFK